LLFSESARTVFWGSGFSNRRQRGRRANWELLRRKNRSFGNEGKKAHFSWGEEKEELVIRAWEKKR